MASTKRDVAELEAMTGKLKRQFDSHLFCLDQKATNKLEILQEWHEYLRKRVELEGDYNKKLESCSDRFLERVTRLRSSTSTKGVAPTPSSTTSDLLYGMLAEAKALAGRRAHYSDQLNNDVLSRIDMLIKDTNLIAKKVREIGIGMHEDMMRSHRDLTEAARAYHAAFSTMSESQAKLVKLQARSAKGKKSATSEKDKKKEMKLITTMMANKRDVIKARNQYILHLKGANVHTQRYFSKGLFELFEYADYDFQWSVSKIYSVQSEAEIGMSVVAREAADSGIKQCQKLDTKQDLQRFMQDFGNYFYPPPEFQFIPAKKEEPQHLTVIDGIFEEMNKERAQLFEKLSRLHLSVEEETKTLECVEKNVANVQSLIFDSGKAKQPTGSLSAADVAANASTEPEEDPGPPPPDVQRKASTNPSGHSRSTSVGNVKSGIMNERKEHMDFLYSVLQRISSNKTCLDKWDSQHTLMDNTLANLTEQDVYKLTQIEVQQTLGVARATRPLPKLFGGSVDEYCLASGDPVPLVVRSCCKHINIHGYKTEGVFRVPGPANEIDELKQKFEQGIDPLIDNDLVDVHAVASLLKQYFRDLTESMFPASMYHSLIAVHPGAGDENRRMIDEVRRLVHSLPVNRQHLLQFLFKFLEDFSVFCEHTKMTGSNIALVFGPTLIGNPPMDPQIMAQGMPLVNRTCLFMLDNRLEIFGDPVVDDVNDGGGSGGGKASAPPAPAAPDYEIDYPVPPADEPKADVPPEPTSPTYAVPESSDGAATYDTMENQGPEFYEEQYAAAYQKISGGANEEMVEPDSDSETDGELEDQRLVHALHDYDARNEKELSFKRGETIEVFQLTADGNWWDAVIGDSRGYIPASYVKELTNTAMPQSSQTDSVDLSASQSTLETSQTTVFERSHSQTSQTQLAPTAAGLLTLPEDDEMKNRGGSGPASAPHDMDHLGEPQDEENRRRSTGEYGSHASHQLTVQPQTSEPATPSSSGNVSTFGPGSSASLDRVSAKVGMFGSQGQGSSSSRPPPVRAKPGKLKASNFEQLQGVIGGGPPMGMAPRPRPGAPPGTAAVPEENVPAPTRPAPVQGQRRPMRH
ncbi:rho GTPase-activating protein 4-like [Sycon ciliatum]|uniref:rho GTPase-activating protein 4-like n=1 Tax=Sycon ciliatum TaxID=27933 RepID=UPI0031F6199B|eukprot:scpid32956/ scgid10319/ SLIT-ROBO Rho GTPase-activating protein 3; Mental disorder-associated GAP; Rho GTPase-activating protein 14; WAVE-associated Rac GTPase-activating protein